MKRFIIAIKLLVSIGIIWYLVAKAQREGQFLELISGDKNWMWFLGACLLCLAFHVVGLIRWFLIARAMQVPISCIDAIRIGFVGQFFGLFAFGVIGGDSMRAYYASRSGPRLLGKAIASVFFDRVIGLLAMTAFAGLGYFLIDWDGLATDSNKNMLLAIRSSSLLLLVLSISGVLFVVVAMTVSERLLMLGYERALRIPFIGGQLGNLIKSIRLIRNQNTTVVQAFLLSILCNVLIIANIYAVARFVNEPHPDFGEHWLISPLAMIANSLPLPGGVGGMEAVLDLLYGAMSPSSEGPDSGAVVGLLFRLVLLLISVMGAVVWLTMSRKDRDALQEAAEHAP